MDVQNLKTLRIIPLHQIIFFGPTLEDVVMGGDEYIQLVDFPVRITFPPILAFFQCRKKAKLVPQQ